MRFPVVYHLVNTVLRTLDGLISKRPKYREFRTFTYLQHNGRWRLKSRQNRLFCTQNKPISTWINAAEYTALAAVDGGGSAVSQRLNRRKGTNDN
jgi:hypothetical protein